MYQRRKLKYHQRLVTMLESLVFEHTPADRPAAGPDIVKSVRDACERHPEDGRYGPAEVAEAIAGLSARGFLLEV